MTKLMFDRMYELLVEGEDKVTIDVLERAKVEDGQETLPVVDILVTMEDLQDDASSTSIRGAVWTEGQAVWTEGQEVHNIL